MDVSPAADLYFVGDLTDPWVARLAAALPGTVGRCQAGECLPRPWPEPVVKAQAVILHRTWLTNLDAERVQSLRNKASGTPRILLCTGLLPRYHELERWVPLVDRIAPETLAPGLLWRWLCPVATATGLELPPRGPRPTVAIVSRVHEIRSLLSEIVRGAGYPVQTGRQWSDVAPRIPALWDVPVLDSGWELELRSQAATRSILSLAGFLDRSLAVQMMDCGSWGVLDLPGDPADLLWLLERLNAAPADVRVHPKHDHPTGPHPTLSLTASAPTTMASDSRAS